jgi:hypothetical protein
MRTAAQHFGVAAASATLQSTQGEGAGKGGRGVPCSKSKAAPRRACSCDCNYDARYVEWDCLVYLWSSVRLKARARRARRPLAAALRSEPSDGLDALAGQVEGHFGTCGCDCDHDAKIAV